jgi:hypothetical protein
MARYTEEFLATARHGYENTDQPMRELARELGIGITTLSTLAEKHGWAKRSQRKRGVPPAMQLLAEAQALAAGRVLDNSIRHPEVRAQRASKGDGPDELPTHGPHPSRLGEERLAPQDDGAKASRAEGGEQIAPEPAELLIKLEQILAQLIAAQQLAPANGIQSPQGARTLTLLIQAMRTLQGMRGHAPTDTGPIETDDDDMPRDLDEFRHALARRIEAFVANETDAEDAGEDSGRADVDAAGQ